MTAPEQIQQHGREAALAGIPTISACPWPVRSPEWFDFHAGYNCASFATDRQRIAIELYFIASNACGPL
jgi:hypothetical protein